MGLVIEEGNLRRGTLEKDAEGGVSLANEGDEGGRKDQQ